MTRVNRTNRPTRARSICWIALGALSVACATGAFAPPPPPPVVEDGGPSEGRTLIAGQVFDSDTEDPIRGARLVLECDCREGTREARSNANGLFVFEDLTPGNYTVRVLYGSEEASKTLLLRADQRLRVRFGLSNEPQVVT